MSEETRGVVVTGASTGIGEATALLLAREGFAVFAGVRKEADAQRLGAQPNVHPVQIDVTKSDEIATAAAAIAGRRIPLAGLVNNAGVAFGGPMEHLPPDVLRRQFEVNVFGAMAVTQAFLPQLRASRGRIVFVGSIAGRLAAPFVGPYSASKFALEAIADVLRIELSSAGIAVSVIEPGPVKTPIWAKGRAGREKLAERLGADAATHYPGVLDTMMEQTQIAERDALPPEIVARAILHALRAPHPRPRYLIGRSAKLQAIVARLPERMRDALIKKALRLS